MGFYCFLCVLMCSHRSLLIHIRPYKSYASGSGSLCVIMCPYVSLCVLMCPYRSLCVLVGRYGSL